MTRKVPRQQLFDIVAKCQPFPEAVRDEMAIPSYLHYNPLIRWLMWRRYEIIAELAPLTREMAVLEFGCGTGVFLPELCERAGTVMATDITPDYAMELSKRNALPVRFVNDFTELVDGSVDCIIAADVLEHLPDLDEVIVTFRKKIRPGGWLIISGPTENKFYQVGRFLAGFSDKGDYHHTAIDAIIDRICHFAFSPHTIRQLPHRLLPCLFKVALFQNAPPTTSR